MLKTGILNPAINSLLSRVRLTTVGFRAEEFRAVNDAGTRSRFEQALAGAPLVYEPDVDFKKRVPQAIGLIRTGDTIQYANVILESA